MIGWIKIPLRCSLSIAALFAMPLIPQAIAQEPQASETPLKDVCREGWSHYSCGQVRMCVSPDVEEQLTTHWGFQHAQGCYRDETLIPDVWAHVSAEVIGYLQQGYGRYSGYTFRTHVVYFDSSTIKNAEPDSLGAISSALRSSLFDQGQKNLVAFDKGMSEFIPGSNYEEPVDSYNIKHQLPKTPATDVCPAAWSRFSCQFVRLCVSPSVASKYDVASSDEFKYAHCKADNRSVPEGDTHFSPHEVGEGALLFDRVYFKAVRLDSSDIFEGDIEEAIRRLVLVPIPPHALMEYDLGYEEGRARFRRLVTKTNEKQKRSEDAPNPH
jgi:hypothetical protein